MKRIKIKCEKCEREISKSNYSKHLKSCDGVKRESFKKLEKCPFCNKDLSSIHGGNHIRWCVENSNNFNKNIEKFTKLKKDLENARNSITLEIRRKINFKIKEAWKNGAYDNVNHHNTFKNKHHSDKTKDKIKESRKKYLLENPEQHPWKHSSKFISAPCEYLKNILIKNKINFKEEFQPLLPDRFFSIDIALIDKKIGIEINGNQHYNKNGNLKPYYQNRHDLIEKNGWKLIEIHYANVYNEDFINQLINSL